MESTKDRLGMSRTRTKDETRNQTEGRGRGSVWSVRKDSREATWERSGDVIVRSWKPIG